MSQIVYLSPIAVEKPFPFLEHGDYKYSEKIAKIVDRELRSRGISVFTAAKSTEINKRDDEAEKMKATLFCHISHKYVEGGFKIRASYPEDDRVSKNCAIRIYKEIRRNKSRIKGLGVKCETDQNLSNVIPSVKIEILYPSITIFSEIKSTEVIGCAIAKAIRRYLADDIEMKSDKVYRVQAAVGTNRRVAEKFAKELKEKGIDAFVI